ncbi:hypothetical protein AB0J47_18390 [Nocardia sp. NPDC049737]|uniref:AAA family ATPase n=1 Tax=unclassified Nocardia TaxID=2637762 RepID=UPI003427D8CD
MTISVYLEGLPGAGKTSIMVTLAAALSEDCLAVPETNPTTADREAMHDRSSQEVTLWYLRRELRRDRLASRLADARHPVVAVFDRSYLSVLAYCWATAAVTGDRDGYRHARAVFDRDIRPHLTPTAAIVLLTTPVATSLHRRRDKADREFEHQWYRGDFLDALAEFYRVEAPTLAVGPLHNLDTTGRPADQIHTALLPVLDPTGRRTGIPVERLAAPLVPRGHGRHLCRPALRRYYETHGGVRVLGQPLGEPIKHHAGVCQFFERHAVLLDETGNILPLDPAMTVDDLMETP